MHPYTTPNEKSFDILVKFLERDVTVVEAFGCFPKRQIGLKAMIKEVSVPFTICYPCHTDICLAVAPRL